MEKMKKPQEGRYMGFYMDSASPKTLYFRVYNGTYFVDKSMMLKEIFKYIDAVDEYILRHKTKKIWKNGYGKHDRSIFNRCSRFIRYF